MLEIQQQTRDEEATQLLAQQEAETLALAASAASQGSAAATPEEIDQATQNALEEDATLDQCCESAEDNGPTLSDATHIIAPKPTTAPTRPAPTKGANVDRLKHLIATTESKGTNTNKKETDMEDINPEGEAALSNKSNT